MLTRIGCLVSLLTLMPWGGVMARFYGEEMDLESWRLRPPEEVRAELDEEMVELLTALEQNPVDINHAGVRRIYELPRVSWALARALVERRKRLGPYRSLDELLVLPGMTPELLWLLRPFLRLRMPREPLSARLRYLGLWREDYSSRQDYLRWRLRRGGHYQGGLLMRRAWAGAYYDPARGRLLARQQPARVRLEALYYAREHQGGQWILGSFVAGFGERLVFDVTRRRQPDGIYRDISVDEYPETGRLRPARTLFGLALEERRANWRALGFISWRPRDIYQYDLRYGPDMAEAFVLGACEHPGSRRGDFTCAADGRWYTNRVLSASDPAEALRYLTLADALEERLAGFHLGYGKARWQWGLTAYVARLNWRLSAPTMRFAPAARYPADGRAHAFGVNQRWQGQRLLWDSELAVSQGGGLAWLGRLTGLRGEGFQWRLLLRHYAPDYVNPYGRGVAAPDEEQGLRQRNEQGVMLQASRTWSRWRWLGEIDLWQQIFVWQAQENAWRRRASPLRHLRFHQRLQRALGRYESLSLSLNYVNKDLAHNGRAQSYPDGSGEARRLWLKGVSRRLPAMRLQVGYLVLWQDVGTDALDFQHLHSRRLYVLGRVWEGISWRLGWLDWRQQSGGAGLDGGRPHHRWRLGWSWRWQRGLHWRLEINRYHYLARRQWSGSLEFRWRV